MYINKATKSKFTQKFIVQTRTEQVLIVSKTRMGNTHFCVGGLTRSHSQNIRLLTNQSQNQPLSTPYNIGDVWEIEFIPREVLTPPHIEDVIVFQHNRLGHAKNVKNIFHKRVPIWRGMPQVLFDGLLRFSSSGSGYISSTVGIPNKSVGFWIPDIALPKFERYDKTRYQYKNLSITYVGVANPIPNIPANTLLRVSLARWWKPDDTDIEKRCYLQLSGWYL